MDGQQILNESASQLNEDTSPPKTAKVKHEIDIIEDDAFTYDGYQVVRGEFFAHLFEPSFTFNLNKVSVNTACIRKLPQIDFVQILVNPEEMKLAVRPCAEDEKDSFRWCSATSKRSPKQITCRMFFNKVFALMQWNPDYRYKLLGKLIHSNNQLLFVFDLTTPEIFMRTIKDDGKPKTSRTPVYPEEWKNQFGVPVVEHQNSLQVNIFDGYAVFGIQKKEEPTSEVPVSNTTPAVQESEENNYEQTTLFSASGSVN